MSFILQFHVKYYVFYRWVQKYAMCYNRGIMRLKLQVRCIATVLLNQHFLYNIYLVYYTILICYVFFFSTITHAKIVILK